MESIWRNLTGLHRKETVVKISKPSGVLIVRNGEELMIMMHELIRPKSTNTALLVTQEKFMLCVYFSGKSSLQQRGFQNRNLFSTRVSI